MRRPLSEEPVSTPPPSRAMDDEQSFQKMRDKWITARVGLRMLDTGKARRGEAEKEWEALMGWQAIPYISHSPYPDDALKLANGLDESFLAPCRKYYITPGDQRSEQVVTWEKHIPHPAEAQPRGRKRKGLPTSLGRQKQVGKLLEEVEPHEPHEPPDAKMVQKQSGPFPVPKVVGISNAAICFEAQKSIDPRRAREWELQNGGVAMIFDQGAGIKLNLDEQKLADAMYHIIHAVIRDHTEYDESISRYARPLVGNAGIYATGPGERDSWRYYDDLPAVAFIPSQMFRLCGVLDSRGRVQGGYKYKRIADAFYGKGYRAGKSFPAFLEKWFPQCRTTEYTNPVGQKEKFTIRRRSRFFMDYWMGEHLHDSQSGQICTEGVVCIPSPIWLDKIDSRFFKLPVSLWDDIEGLPGSLDIQSGPKKKRVRLMIGMMLSSRLPIVKVDVPKLARILNLESYVGQGQSRLKEFNSAIRKAARACEHLGYLDGCERRGDTWVFGHSEAKLALSRPGKRPNPQVVDFPVCEKAG